MRYLLNGDLDHLVQCKCGAVLAPESKDIYIRERSSYSLNAMEAKRSVQRVCRCPSCERETEVETMTES